MGVGLKRCGVIARSAAVAAVLVAGIDFASGECLADSPVLARVNRAGSAGLAGLPIYSILRDVEGVEYALVIASPSRLANSGAAWRLLDREAAPERYLIALPMREEARAAAAGRFAVVYDDGVQWVVRLRAEEDASTLADLGFELARMSAAPLAEPPPLRAGARSLFLETFVSNAWIGAAMAAVRSNDLISLVSQLTGEEPRRLAANCVLLAPGTPIRDFRYPRPCSSRMST